MFRLFLFVSISSVVYVVIFVNLLSEKNESNGAIEVIKKEVVMSSKQMAVVPRHSLGVAGLSKHRSYRNNSRSVLVFTRCNRQAVLFAADAWRMRGKLLLVVNETCFAISNDFTYLRALQMTRPDRLAVVPIGNQCNPRSLAGNISSRDITEVHVIVESDDFRLGDSPHDLGEINRCYVSLLEALKSHRQPDVEFFFHTRHTLMTSSSDFRFMTSNWTEGLSPCNSNHAETIYGDVMLCILYMYTSAYESLYNLKNIHIALDY